MTNLVFPKFKQRMLSPGVDLAAGYIGTASGGSPTAATLKAALVSSAYAYAAANEFFSAISANVIGTPVALANATVTSGVLDADDVVFTSVAEGSTVGFVAVYLDTGTAATSPLVALFDTESSGAISLETNGTNITVKWDSGSAKIFAL